MKIVKRLVLKVLYYLSVVISDRMYLKIVYFIHMGKRLNLEDPKTFNEKLNWMKLYDRNPLYTSLVDKYEVKKFVREKIGDEYVIPTIGIWDNVEEINWDILPNQFVLKTTHGGGNVGVVICRDKRAFDIGIAKQRLRKSLKQDLYKICKEWPYKNVKPRIIAEPYVEDSLTKELRDYKFFCFDGQVRCLFVASERQNREEPFFDFFDVKYEPLPIKQGHPNSVKKPKKPQCFDEMLLLSSKLSEGLPQVRVDLYEVDGKVLFGELTFFHFGAFVPFEPESWDYELGSCIKL